MHICDMHRVKRVLARRVEFVDLGLETLVHLGMTHKAVERAAQNRSSRVRASDQRGNTVRDDDMLGRVNRLLAVFVTL